MKVPDFVRWMKQYEDLPLLMCKPSKLDDDGMAFQSDMEYFKDLLLEIQLQAMATRQANPFPAVLSNELDHAINELAGIKSHIQEISRDRR